MCRRRVCLNKGGDERNRFRALLVAFAKINNDAIFARALHSGSASPLNHC